MLILNSYACENSLICCSSAKRHSNLPSFSATMKLFSPSNTTFFSFVM